MLLTQDFIKWLRDPEMLLNHLLGTYGVWMIVFIALTIFIKSDVLSLALSSDSVLFAIGLLQDRMPMNLIVICLVIIAAAICSEQVGCWFGLLFGEKLLKDDAKILKTEYLKSSKVSFSKWGGPAVAPGRLIPFIRAPMPIAAGIGRYHWSRFTLWNVTGAIAWTLTFVTAGVLLDDIPLVRDDVEAITVIIIVFSVLPIAVGLMGEHPDIRRYTVRPHSATQFSTVCGKWLRGTIQTRYSG